MPYDAAYPFPSAIPNTPADLVTWAGKVRRWAIELTQRAAIAGDTGDTGAGVWMTYHNAAIDAMPTVPLGAGNLDGWHTNVSGGEKWMSHKRSTTIEDAEISWSSPILMKGEDGKGLLLVVIESAPQAVFHYDSAGAVTPESIVLTAHAFYGGLELEADDGVTFAWSGLKTGEGPTIEVLAEDVDGSGVQSVTATLNNFEGYDTITLLDVSDGKLGNYVDYIFSRASSLPATPDAVATPAGWSDTPPAADGNPLFMSKATKTGEGVLIGTWSTPVQLDGGNISVEYSVTGAGDWHAEFALYDVYMRQKLGGGTWSEAIKIVGEDGAEGPSGPYTDYLFRRAESATAPATDNPMADTPQLWFDAPPAADGNPLWMTKANKTAAGVVVGVWSTPVQLDGGTISVEYSVTGLGDWHAEFALYDVYMRQKLGAGDWSAAIKIVGEDGAAGEAGPYTDYLFRRASSASAPESDNPMADTPQLWFDAPPAADSNPLWMTKANKTGAGTVAGVWSTPVQLDGGNLSIEYSVSGTGSWHTMFASGDLYMRQKLGAGDWSAAMKIVGENGANGVDGPYTDYLFRRASSATAPVTDNPMADTPQLWFDAPPAADGSPLWMVKASKTAAGVVVGTWSTPVQLDGGNLSIEYSVTGSGSWHTTFTSGDLYMRQKLGAGDWSAAMKIIGEDGASVSSRYATVADADEEDWHTTFTAGDLFMQVKLGSGAWSASMKIVGEDGGAAEAGGYADYRFKRASTQPATPTGDAPAGWTGAPPAADGNPLWMSMAWKTAAGTLETGATWSAPVRLDGNEAKLVRLQVPAQAFIYRAEDTLNALPYSLAAPWVCNSNAAVTTAATAAPFVGLADSVLFSAASSQAYISQLIQLATTQTESVEIGGWFKMAVGSTAPLSVRIHKSDWSVQYATTSFSATPYADGGWHYFSVRGNIPAGTAIRPNLYVASAAGISTVAFWDVRVRVAKTVTLTAQAANFVPGAYAWERSDDSGATWSTVSGATAATLVVQSGDFYTSRAFRVTCDADTALRDAMTLVNLRDGASSATALLTNEAHTLAADAAGAVASFAGASTQMLVYVGTVLDATWTITKVDGAGVTSTLSGNTVTVSALSADTGYVDITASKTGWGDLVKRFSLAKSRTGSSGNYADYRFQRADTIPGTPSGATPAGWYDAPPADNGKPLWMSKANKTAAGALVGSWSTPVRIDGGTIAIEYSVTGATSWHTTFTTGDLYMRQKIGGGDWSAAIKVVGEVGATGLAGPYTDFRFQRALTLPATPSGPTPAGWYDAPPAANGNPLWMVKASKTAAGALVGSWSTPIQVDGDKLSVEYSTGLPVDTPASWTWHATFVTGDFYMHQRLGVSGAWSAAIKMVGENGADGADGPYTDYRFRRAATIPDTPSGPTPAGWYDAPPAANGNPLWMSKVSKAADGTLLGTWSAPVQIDGAAAAIEYSTGLPESTPASWTWHATFATGDLYMRQRIGSTGAWSDPIRIAGEHGEPALSAIIVSNNGLAFRKPPSGSGTTPASITLSLSVYDGPTLITTGYTVAWKKADVAAATTATLTLGPDDVYKSLKLTATVTYGTKTAVAEETVIDVTDGAALLVQYSANGIGDPDSHPGNWHPVFVSGTDLYMIEKIEGGTWSAAKRIVGQTGAAGDKGIGMWLAYHEQGADTKVTTGTNTSFIGTYYPASLYNDKPSYKATINSVVKVKWWQMADTDPGGAGRWVISAAAGTTGTSYATQSTRRSKNGQAWAAPTLSIHGVLWTKSTTTNGKNSFTATIGGTSYAIWYRDTSAAWYITLASARGGSVTNSFKGGSVPDGSYQGQGTYSGLIAVDCPETGTYTPSGGSATLASSGTPVKPAAAWEFKTGSGAQGADNGWITKPGNTNEVFWVCFKASDGLPLWKLDGSAEIDPTLPNGGPMATSSPLWPKWSNDEWSEPLKMVVSVAAVPVGKMMRYTALATPASGDASYSLGYFSLPTLKVPAGYQVIRASYKVNYSYCLWASGSTATFEMTTFGVLKTITAPNSNYIAETGVTASITSGVYVSNIPVTFNSVDKTSLSANGPDEFWMVNSVEVEIELAAS